MAHSGRVSEVRFEVDGFKAYFRIQRDPDSGVYPDWDQDLIENTEHIQGSNSSITQMSGFTLATIKLRLRFDTRAAYTFFRKLTGSTGTLVLLANFTSLEGEVRHEMGRDYEYFSNTTMMRYPKNVANLIGEDHPVECDGFFVRAFDPVTNTAVLP